MQRSRIINVIRDFIGVAILLLLFTTIDYHLTLSLLMQVDVWFLLLACFCYFLKQPADGIPSENTPPPDGRKHRAAAGVLLTHGGNAPLGFFSQGTRLK